MCRVNCPFYFKIGACRHGDKCERRHNKPSLSQTLLVTHMWPNPLVNNPVPQQDEKTLQDQFNEFYEDVFEELSNFGEVEELNVCENVGDHLVGNVYVKFHKEEQASEALVKLQGRFYGGTWGASLYGAKVIVGLTCPFHSVGVGHFSYIQIVGSEKG